MCFLICVTALCAQDSTAQEKKGIIATVREKYNEAKTRLTNRTDSLRSSVAAPTDSLKRSPSDSLKRLSDPSGKDIDSIQHHAVNTISKVNEAGNPLNNSVDSIQQKINAPVNKVNEKISEAENTVKEKVNLGEKGVNAEVDKLEGKIDAAFSKATDGTVVRPGEDINLTADGLEIPGTKLEGANIDGSVPGVDAKIPGADELNIPKADLSIDGLKEKAGIDIPHGEKIEKITSEVQNIDGRLAEGEQYENEIRQVSKGDLSSAEKLPELAEDKVENLEQLQAANAELQKATAAKAKHEALIARYKDKKALQKEIERKALNIATEKINQNAPAFKEAQAQLAKIKKLNPAVESYKDLKKKRANAMKGKPFYERLVPGITVEAYQNDKIFTVNWGAQLGYKISGRFLIGAGGLYRTSFSEHYHTWIKSDHVYGYRTYLNAGMYKSFYTHTEFAARYGKIDLKVPETEKQRVYSGYFGLGKRYDISRKLKGSILVLYHAQLKGHMPSTSRVNMRIEFNYNTKKRKKSSWDK